MWAHWLRGAGVSGGRVKLFSFIRVGEKNVECLDGRPARGVGSSAYPRRTPGRLDSTKQARGATPAIEEANGSTRTAPGRGVHLLGFLETASNSGTLIGSRDFAAPTGICGRECSTLVEGSAG